MGYRNLTPEKIYDIGASISTVHAVVENLRFEAGMLKSRGMRDRHPVNKVDEPRILDTLKQAGFGGASSTPSFGSDSDLFDNLDPNPIGGIDIVHMRSWLKNRTEHLIAYQNQVMQRVHPIPAHLRG